MVLVVVNTGVELVMGVDPSESTTTLACLLWMKVPLSNLNSRT